MIAGVVTYVVTINYSDTRGERPRFGPWLILSPIIWNYAGVYIRRRITFIMYSLNAICSTTSRVARLLRAGNTNRCCHSIGDRD